MTFILSYHEICPRNTAVILYIVSLIGRHAYFFEVSRESAEIQYGDAEGELVYGRCSCLNSQLIWTFSIKFLPFVIFLITFSVHVSLFSWFKNSVLSKLLQLLICPKRAGYQELKKRFFGIVGLIAKKI